MGRGFAVFARHGQLALSHLRENAPRKAAKRAPLHHAARCFAHCAPWRPANWWCQDRYPLPDGAGGGRRSGQVRIFAGGPFLLKTVSATNKTKRQENCFFCVLLFFFCF